VVLLVLALGGTVAAAANVPRTYQAEGSVVLLASRALSKANGSNNPYLSFSPSLTLTAEVLSGEMMSPTTLQTLAADGFRDTYTVVLAAYTPTTTGSALTVTVTGSDPAGVVRDLGGVMAEVQAKLASLQTGVAPYNRIRVVTIARSQRAALSVSRTARPLVVVALCGLLVAFGLPWLVDAQLARRRARPGRPEELDLAVASGREDPGTGDLAEPERDSAADEPTGPDIGIYQPFAPQPAGGLRTGRVGGSGWAAGSGGS
jgi:hypothetical protein